MSKFCKTCGAELSENAKFCGKCGAQVSDNMNLNSEAGKKEDTDRKKKKRKRLIAITVAVLVVVIIFSTQKTNPVRDMKNIVFDQYGTLEFGNVVKRAIPDAKWESEKLGKKHYTVTVQGFCPNLYSDIELAFDINYSGDSVYAKLKYGYIDGEYFDDLFSSEIVMEGLYE